MGLPSVARSGWSTIHTRKGIPCGVSVPNPLPRIFEHSHARGRSTVQDLMNAKRSALILVEYLRTVLHRNRIHGGLSFVIARGVCAIINEIGSCGPNVTLDLEEITIVDVHVVGFLGACERQGSELLHCPPMYESGLRDTAATVTTKRAES
jgi:hypothetical protein